MKNIALLAIVIALMLAGSLCAGTDPILATNNAQTVFMDEGSFLSPLCTPGDLCGTSQFGLAPGDGSPMPVCQPPKSCHCRLDACWSSQCLQG